MLVTVLPSARVIAHRCCGVRSKTWQRSRSPLAGVTSIIIAALANTLVKCGMVVALGAPGLRRPILGATAAIVGSGLLALWLA